MRLRHRLIDLGFRAIGSSGVGRLAAPWTRGLGVIFTLHHVRPFTPTGFAPNRLLEITPDFLDAALKTVIDAGFDLVDLDEAAERIENPKRAARPFAAFTFDDGYTDNVRYALPVMWRYRAPWTMFVTTGFAEGAARLWWLELEEAIRRLTHIGVRLDDGTMLDCPAATDAQKAAAYEMIYWRLRAGPEDELLRVTQALAAAARFEPAAITRNLCLTWDEVRAVAAERNVSIGAHTLTHKMLAKHEPDVARDEIFASKARIEAQIGREVRHLAYPVGDPGSAGLREFKMAGEAGFRTAVTTRPGHVFAGHARHLHALPRVSLNGYFQSPAAVRTMLSGLPFALWNQGRRINAA